MKKYNGIDNDMVLNHYYEDRETFVVDFNTELVEFSVFEGEVIFKLKKRVIE